MFFTLFLKECRQILKSLVFYIYIVIFVFFINGQMGTEIGDVQFKPPVPGQEYYGDKMSVDENAIMEKTLPNLLRDAGMGRVSTYPLGFYKEVKLSEEETETLKEYLKECTGKDFETLCSEKEAYYAEFDTSKLEEFIAADTSYGIPVKEGFDYEDFTQVMKKVTKIVGKGSEYDKSSWDSGVSVPMTYEDAVEEYDSFINKDKVTGAFGRLFCDYAGIVLSLLPVFLGVSRAIKDKRMKADEVIYSKAASGSVIIWSRYLANIMMMFLPVVIMAFVLQQPYVYQCATFGIKADPFAFLYYTVIWLLPEIMIVMALAFLITEATGSILAVFVQTGWAFMSLMSAAVLVGDFGFQLVARWNSSGKSLMFYEQQSSLFLNRGVFFGLSLVFVLLTAAVFERKRRRGGVLYGKSRKS